MASGGMVEDNYMFLAQTLFIYQIILYD